MTYDDPKNDYLENSYDFDYPDFDEDYIDSERNTAEGARTKNHSNRENNNLVTVLKMGTQVPEGNNTDISENQLIKSNFTTETNSIEEVSLDFKKDENKKQTSKVNFSNNFLHRKAVTAKKQILNEDLNILNKTEELDQRINNNTNSQNYPGKEQNIEDKENFNKVHEVEKHNSEQLIHNHEINKDNIDDLPPEEDNLMNTNLESTTFSTSKLVVGSIGLKTSLDNISDLKEEPRSEEKSNKSIQIHSFKRGETKHNKHFKSKDNSSNLLNTDLTMKVTNDDAKKDVEASDNLDSVKKSLDIDMLKALLLKHKRINK